MFLVRDLWRSQSSFEAAIKRLVFSVVSAPSRRTLIRSSSVLFDRLSSCKPKSAAATVMRLCLLSFLAACVRGAASWVAGLVAAALVPTASNELSRSFSRLVMESCCRNDEKQT